MRFLLHFLKLYFFLCAQKKHTLFCPTVRPIKSIIKTSFIQSFDSLTLKYNCCSEVMFCISRFTPLPDNFINTRSFKEKILLNFIVILYCILVCCCLYTIKIYSNLLFIVMTHKQVSSRVQEPLLMPFEMQRALQLYPIQVERFNLPISYF